MRRFVQSAALGVALAVLTAVPANASVIGDFAVVGSVTAVDNIAGSSYVEAHYYTHNYGPGSPNVVAYTDIVVPGGTELSDTFFSQNHYNPGCTVLVPKKHVLCKNYAQIPVDGHYNAPLEGYPHWLPLKVVSKSNLTCGKVKWWYDADPKMSNNTAYIRLTSHGLPSSCTAKPKPTASPSAKSPSPTPLPSASPSPATTSIEASAPPISFDSPAVALSGDESGSGSAGPAVAVAAAALVAVGAGWWLRRRRRHVDGAADSAA